MCLLRIWRDFICGTEIKVVCLRSVDVTWAQRKKVSEKSFFSQTPVWFHSTTRNIAKINGSPTCSRQYLGTNVKPPVQPAPFPDLRPPQITYSSEDSLIKPPPPQNKCSHACELSDSAPTRWLVGDRHFTQEQAMTRSSIHKADLSVNGEILLGLHLMGTPLNCFQPTVILKITCKKKEYGPNAYHSIIFERNAFYFNTLNLNRFLMRAKEQFVIVEGRGNTEVLATHFMNWEWGLMKPISLLYSPFRRFAVIAIAP